MRALGLAAPGDRLSVLCLGAHSDDIEIGAGGTLLESARARRPPRRALVRLERYWGAGERGEDLGV